jgi:hypothetical protein
VVPSLAIADAKDDDFMRAAVGVVLAHNLPAGAVPTNFKFRLEDTGKGYLADTDLNFAKLTEVYHQRVPPSHSSLTPEYVLAKILTARSESYFAADFLAELVTAPESSQIIRLKHYDFLRARDRSTASLELFKEVALPSVPTIREVINSKERSISEFLALLDQAQKFKEWLKKGENDPDLAAQYIKAAITETWADKLPTKATRLAFFTGAGLLAEAVAPSGIGTATGVGLSTADALVFDKLVKGWKPNHFIEGPYTTFVDKEG